MRASPTASTGGSASAGALGSARPSPAPAEVPSAERTRGKQRDPFFDNAKYLAIVLVAIGHSWEPLRSGSRSVTALYTLVYAVHIAGVHRDLRVLLAELPGDAAADPAAAGGVVVPYVVFETAYTLYTRWTDHQPDRAISLLDPLYLTWFLAALFVWRLTTPIWKHVRQPLPVALVIAMLATLSPSIGNDLDLQRVLQFLPYFVLGLCLKPEHFQLVRRPEVRQLAVPVFVVALAVAYWSVPRFDYSWFFHNASAEQLGVPAWEGPLMTLALFVCSTLLVVCFLAWVPRRRTWFTALGAGTLYGYLLHGFLAQGAKSWGWYDPSWMRGPLGEVTVTVVAAVVVTALCTAPVRRVFRGVMEPELTWAFRRDADELARTP